MRNLLVVSLISIVGFITNAETTTYVMMDGSVASCASQEDVSGKAFKLSAVVDVKGLQFIKVENLVCQKSKKSFNWASEPLSAETSFDTISGVAKATITKAFLQVTDFEGQTELQKINLDVDAAEQTVVLSEKVTQQNKVSAVIQSYQITTLDGVVMDEGFNSSGRIVIKLK